MSTEHTAGQPVKSRPFRAMERVVGPVVKTLLRSPMHGPLSKSLLMIGFNGRRSGKRYEIVVGYREHNDVIEIVSPRTWWKNLQGGNAEVDVTFRGKQRRGRAEVHHGDQTVIDVYRRLMTDSASVVKIYGVTRNADGTVDDESLRAAVRTCAVVLVRLDPA